MKPLHPVLERQLRRLGVNALPTESQWRSWLEMVDTTYSDADQDREMLERALTISSREMRELYADLETSSNTKLALQRDQLLAADAVKAAVLEASPDGMLVIDSSRRVVICNRRFAEIWKIPEDVYARGDDHELLGYALRLLVDPQVFLARVAELYDDPFATSEDELELNDGRRIERFSRPAIDVDGVVRGRLWIFRDVTARRRDEATLRDAHGFLNSIIECLPNMVFVKDAEQLRFVRFNRAGEQLLGVDRSALLGRCDHDMFPVEQADGFVAKDREVLAQRDVVTVAEEQISTAHGPRRLRTRKIPIRDSNDRPVYLLGISEDITEERARSAELYLAKEHAEKASRAKSEFLLNMSHEMRTPLNAILGFARVLPRPAAKRLDPDEQAHLTDILAAGEHMLRLINDLLDLRSLESVALEVQPLELILPLHEAMRMIQPLAAEREQTISLDVAPTLPLCIGERRAIVQVLVNLMTNATKFTPAGGKVELRASSSNGMIRLAVIDNGCGIAPEDQTKLFNYFEQLGAKHQHHMKGSGVGLALTRALVEKMGGEISVASVVGQGTTFEVRLREAA